MSTPQLDTDTWKIVKFLCAHENVTNTCLTPRRDFSNSNKMTDMKIRFYMRKQQIEIISSNESSLRISTFTHRRWYWYIRACELLGYIDFSDIYSVEDIKMIYVFGFCSWYCILWNLIWCTFCMRRSPVLRQIPPQTKGDPETWPLRATRFGQQRPRNFHHDLMRETDRERWRVKNWSRPYNPVPPSKDFRRTKPELKRLVSPKKKKKSDQLTCVLKCTVYQRHSHCTYNFVSRLDRKLLGFFF